ncbi:peptide chain release factor N(5)-glutamine methyltransferase [Acetobacterium tundrae]|uniref:Release factor glutamine methyltransferase n=1 Tax=Acetobacterium tundrae TaxID=132932 RepID=A0ABR6WLT0_9FIRM|nr:peptide chain release factor N(5)-glutamine methyltransferase [Acetobacterium tundrae]MBC3797439.1 peptide chain release factor N(5)-glutamine methyltransferase [Acetobacterium tundrae]
MEIREMLDSGRQALNQAGIVNPGLEAEIILSGVLNCDRVYFYAHPHETVDSIKKEAYFKAIKRRCQDEPVAYILGKKEFMGMGFLVNQDVLIPRPDTEPMVEYLIKRLNSDYPDGAKILDLCTGSGAIGISLKKNIPQGMVALSDFSKRALSVAKANADHLVEGNLILYEGDLFKAIPEGEKFDLIVSNPPYIKRTDMNDLAPDILQYEPHMALDGGISGLDFYERIIEAAGQYLRRPGLLALEIGDEQMEPVFNLLTRHGYVQIEKILDLSGHVRSLIGKKTENNDKRQ